jgi:4-oxalocrotonate tautomerase
MPHITVELYTGRDEQTKMKIAHALSKALGEELNMSEKMISVAIKDIPKENWKAEVYDRIVDPNNQEVLIKPRYDM